MDGEVKGNFRSLGEQTETVKRKCVKMHPFILLSHFKFIILVFRSSLKGFNGCLLGDSELTIISVKSVLSSLYW